MADFNNKQFLAAAQKRRARIYKLHLSGVSNIEISRRLKISRERVRQIVNKEKER